MVPLIVRFSSTSSFNSSSHPCGIFASVYPLFSGKWKMRTKRRREKFKWRFYDRLIQDKWNRNRRVIRKKRKSEREREAWAVRIDLVALRACWRLGSRRGPIAGQLLSTTFSSSTLFALSLSLSFSSSQFHITRYWHFYVLTSILHKNFV